MRITPGRLRISMCDSSRRRFVAVTGDLARSREIPNRAQVQSDLKTALSRINQEFSNVMAVAFGVTIGDEFQGLLHSLPASYRIAQEVERALYPVRVVVGVGVGLINTGLADTTREMDGECFHLSREALETAKAEKQSILFQTGNELIDEAVNTIVRLIDTIRRDWKDLHYRRAWAYEEMRAVEKVAHSEGVTPQAVWETLKKASVEEVERARQTIGSLLRSVGPEQQSRREP